jgi:hypothetical protein
MPDSGALPPTIERSPDAAPTTKVMDFNWLVIFGGDLPARCDGRSNTMMPTATDISYAT